MKIAARSDIGITRKSNQDSIYYNDHGLGCMPNLMIVADGMGGHKAGEKASELAVTGMVDQLMQLTQLPDNPGKKLAECAQIVNYLVYEAALTRPEWEGMGTTLVAAVCDKDMLYCINVGDSRLYVLEETESGACRLRRVTVDHSVVEEMVAAGLITSEEAWHHPKKNLITRAIGQEKNLRVDIYMEPLAHVQMVLLCSDGLTDMVEDKDILKILLSEDSDAEVLVEKLKMIANECGGRDNISVIIADMRGE